ncbi:hypothetical protein ACFPRL_14990 [Pseudoclavibacter helvolus]
MTALSASILSTLLTTSNEESAMSTMVARTADILSSGAKSRVVSTNRVEVGSL